MSFGGVAGSPDDSEGVGWGTWCLVAVLAVAAGVRLVALAHQSLDHDEAVTAVRVLHPSLWDTLGVVASGERSPPLYYLLAWAWSKPFGISEAGLRSLPALIGTATVLAAYWTGKAFAGRHTGLVAAALFALNPYLIWYSQEARSYALLTLTVTIGLGCLIRALDQPSRRNLSLWALASIAALLSHYFAVFLIAPQMVLLLMRLAGRQRRITLIAVFSVVACGLALLPLVVSQEGSGRRNGFTGKPIVSRTEESLLNFVAGEEPGPFAGRTPVDLVQALAAAAGLAIFGFCGWLLWRAPRSTTARARPLLLAFVFAFGAPVALAFVGIDFLNPRNMIGALVPLLLLVAIALAAARLPARSALLALGTTLAAFAFVGVATYVSGQMQRPNYRAAADALRTDSGKLVVVALINANEPLRYYLGARVFDHAAFPSGIHTRRLSALSTNFRVKAPPGFHEVDRGTAGGVFLTWHFQSNRPRKLTPSDLKRVLDERSKVLATSW